MNELVNKQTLFDHWSGKSTPLQRKLITEWLKDPENIEQYYSWLDEWEHTNLLTAVNVNQSFEKFMSRQHADSEVGPQSANHFFLSRKMFNRIAVAAIIIGIISTIAFFSIESILYKQEVSLYGETKALTLPDGSTVFMNSNSSLRYARFGFANKDRKVYIKGEAEFSVVHTSNNSRFEVVADNDLKISVLGTRFVVYARGKQQKVVLSQGKIELSVPVGDTIQKNIMLPGDMFAINPKEGVRRLKVDDPEESAAWKNHEFHFEGTSLEEIGQLVKDNFGYELSFETQALANKTISGSFHAETVDDLVDAIAQLIRLNYKYKDHQIHFSE